ncbi:MAG: ABC transporter permease [Thiothrix sp.]|nr:MAG: ABC transporter permease [Thiothrix sp.]
MQNMFNRKEVLISTAVFIVFLIFWQWGPTWFGIPNYIIPPASDVYHEFIRMLGSDKLMYHTLYTAKGVLIGFFLGALLGMIIGYILGMSPTAEFVLSPYILALQIAPKVAFAPLFVMWFGFTSTPKILVAVLIVFFPIMVNVLGAIRTIDRDLINLVNSFKASRLQLFWKVEFRAAMPSLFSGLRIASTLAVIGIVVGEMVGGNEGLGYLLVWGSGSANTSMVFVSIIMLTLIGLVAYLAVIWAENKVLHYIPKRSSTGPQV